MPMMHTCVSVLAKRKLTPAHLLQKVEGRANQIAVPGPLV